LIKVRVTLFYRSNAGEAPEVDRSAYALHAGGAGADGMITVVAAAGSYTRMLWKVGNYNALRHEQETLKVQYHQLQSTVNDTNQRLDSLQSLATEVAMTYGVLRYHPAHLMCQTTSTAEDAFDRSVEQYTFLKKNAAAIAISSGGLRLMPSFSFADSSYTPAILAGAWPHHGQFLASDWIPSAVKARSIRAGRGFRLWSAGCT